MAQVVWYVDGRPYRVADDPFIARWPLAPGTHSFQARLAFSTLSSPTVHVRVD